GPRTAGALPRAVRDARVGPMRRGPRSPPAERRRGAPWGHPAGSTGAPGAARSSLTPRTAHGSVPPAMRRLVRPSSVILVLVAAGWATRTVGLAGPLTPASLRTLVDAYAPWGGLAFMALCGASGALYAVPPLLIIALGGAVLGPRLAFVYGWSGLLAGALLAF